MGARLSVLVVEDDEQVLEVITLELEAAGYTVYKAMDGRGAVELALEAKPSLVLCDHGLPGFSGQEVLAALRSNEDTRSIPFVLMTGGILPLAERHNFAFLQKPFLPEEVRRIVDVHIAGMTNG